MNEQQEPDRTTYVLVDGENIDATLGTILGRRPGREERARWDRLLHFATERFGQPASGLFFLAANHELPMPFIQALVAMGWRPVPLSGAAGEKVVDIGIQRTLTAIAERSADVVLVSNDSDFVTETEALLDGSRRVGLVGFREFRSQSFLPLVDRGLELFDLEADVNAFQQPLPRVRIIPIDQFDPAEFL